MIRALASLIVLPRMRCFDFSKPDIMSTRAKLTIKSRETASGHPREP